MNTRKVEIYSSAGFGRKYSGFVSKGVHSKKTKQSRSKKAKGVSPGKVVGIKTPDQGVKDGKRPTTGDFDEHSKLTSDEVNKNKWISSATETRRPYNTEIHGYT